MPVPKEAVDAMLRPLLAQFPLGLGKREVALLPDVLQPGEVVFALTSGAFRGSIWLVVATNWRVLFLDKGLLGGLKQLDLPLQQIQGVASNIGWTTGDVSIATGGVAWSIQNTEKKSTRHFTDTLNQLVQQAQGAPRRPPPVPVHASSEPDTSRLATSDPLAQLERLAQLKQSGMLTEQEFAAAKARLLGV